MTRVRKPGVGFIGVGRIGGLMEGRLIDAGFDLTVHDSNAALTQPLLERGAKAAASPAEVASQATIVLASLPAPSEVELVALGPAGILHGTQVRIWIDTSTTGPTCAKRVAARLAEAGIHAVDAPVSGGRKGARQGTLALMVSCPSEVLEQVEPVLVNLGRLFHVGRDPGQGQTMKLLNNLLTATAMAVTSEAVVMGVKAGLDPALMLDVINSGTGRNSASVDKFPCFVLPRTFNLGFSLGLLNKDVKLCMDEAEALRIPMVVGSAVRQLLAIATAREGDDADMTEMVKPVERWAGVTVGSPKETSAN
jgi:3-hydroxyisobutyrate dehydrogenase-like beta-hydroxyacid dehydrogenase